MADEWKGIRLDKSKPKGRICGPPPVPTAKYEQNGYYFNVEGVCVGVDRSVKQAKPVKEEKITEEQDRFTGDADNMPHEELKELVMGLANSGFNASEIAEHMNQNDINISRQKVSAVIRKNK